MRVGFSLSKLTNLSDAQRTSIIEAMAWLDERKHLLLIDDSSTASADDIAAKVGFAAADGAFGLIIVDYLQLVRTPKSKNTNREQEVAEISRSLKRLAMQMKTPVIALAQLNRAVEARTNKTPMLSDLRESGSLEQDADIVMFLHREELYDPTTDKKGIAELTIAKHRNGETGVIPLRFNASLTSFNDLERYRTPEGF
jgi:replicative DNA helicase